MSVPCSVVFITVPNRKSADTITTALLEEKLAACVNQVPGVRSHFWWKGILEDAEEILLIVKTRSALLQPLVELVRKNHPYSVPEVISFPIADGNKAYLEWIVSSTAGKGSVRK